jgi:exopolysaccharide production protein ExoQ
MIHSADHNADASSTNCRLFWLMVVFVGAVFFFVAHNFQVSQYEDFAPWSDSDGTMEAGSNVVKGLALSLIGLLGLYLLWRRDGQSFDLAGWLPLLIVGYLALSMASVLWSINPGMSCRRLAVLMFCVLGAAGFARQFRPRDVAIMALAISGAYLLVGICAEVALGTFRPWSSGYRFAGTVHPNTQGAHLAVFCFAAFCLARSATPRRAWLWTLLAVGLIFLLLTKSRTSCAALAVAMTVLWMVGTSSRARVLAIARAGLVICAAALAGTLFGIDDKIAEAAMLGRHEESEALTGRVPIWTELLGYVRERPLVGYGYESFWTAKRIEAVSDEMQWPLREAHNAYVDAVLSVGLIGAAVFVAAMLLSLFRAAAAYRATGDAGFAFTLCILVACLVNACLESGMMSPSFTTLLAGCGVAQLFTLPCKLKSFPPTH